MFSSDIWLALALSFSTAVSIILLLLPASYRGKDDHAKKEGKGSPTIQVLVLGDIGRSPRMQYHALSIAKNGGHVDLIGYQDSELHPGIPSNSSITVHYIPPIPDYLRTHSTKFFLLFGPLKVFFQLWSLWVVLGYRTKPAKWLIVQNPPSIPTLFIAQIICFLRNTRLIIDWHNFGYSILALKLGHRHPLVRISHLYERVFSRSAIAHFTVTDVMARILRQEYHLTTPILPLHDRPASHFQPLDMAQRLAFLGAYFETASSFEDIEKGRLKLLVSSTSWTPDEDFSLLLDALVDYSELATTSHPQLPEILAIITGKGPQKAHYLSKIAILNAQGKLEMVTIKTAWLSTEDYARLLGAADLGVSLHMSSSGVDLPMKVVDMFGAGLPVIGWGKFEAWSELVKEGVNGRGFGSAADLRDLLVDLFGGDDSQLRTLKEGARKEGRHRWDDEWDLIAGRLLGLCRQN